MVVFSNLCEVIWLIKQVVDGCLDSEEKWKERVVIKNCIVFVN